ncbi:MAG: hypothetical protein BV459_05670 [Thermoplasmata archaeon M11B2D]|nr:MAG: hypothetical protein BV459_05670 [Thermoplasmata archaeon M11B2D]
MVKLNIGCGPYKEPGYINIDKNPVWKADLTSDVRDGLAYEDNSVDEIRAHHFIEHLDKDEIVSFLTECYTKLKPDGILDLLFPIGVTFELDHKSFLKKESFDIFLRGAQDDYYFGPKIAFSLVKESRFSDARCEMQRLVFKPRGK